MEKVLGLGLSRLRGRSKCGPVSGRACCSRRRRPRCWGGLFESGTVQNNSTYAMPDSQLFSEATPQDLGICIPTQVAASALNALA